MWRSLVLWLSVVGGVWGQASYTLPFRPLDAEYSVPLNRIILVGNSPNQLHIYDPATQIDVAVNLPAPPIDLALSPDGMRAAVSHDGSISVVNLFSGTIERPYTVTGRVRGVVFGPTYLYAETGQDFQTNLHTISLATGTSVQTQSTGLSLVNAPLHPREDAIYATGTYSSTYLHRIKLSAGTMNFGSGSGTLQANGSCGRNWLSSDGESIFNGCSFVYWTRTQEPFELKFRGAIPEVSSLRALTEMTGRNEIAVVANSRSDARPLFNESEVRVYSAASYRLAGRFALGSLTVNAIDRPNQGRWVFNNGGSELYVIVQADPLAGLTQDFSLRVYDLAAQAPCTPTLSVTSSSASSDGGLFSVNVTGGADCLHQVQSSAPWIVGLDERLRTGQRELRYMVRPNTGAARSGTLSVGGQTLTISQAAVAPPANPLPLSFRLMDASYSKGQNKMILLAVDPPELHIFDPLANTDQIVPLRQGGTTVAVDGTGQVAAVGHAGWISVVNLLSGTVTREYPVITDAASLAWGENGYLYILPRLAGGNAYSLRLSDGELTAYSNYYGGSSYWIRKQPGTPLLYSGSGRLSTADGPLSAVPVNSYWSFNCADRYWFYEGGQRLLAGCGDLYRTSSDPTEVPTLAGQLNAGQRQVFGASHSELRRILAVVAPISNSYTSTPEDEVRLYGEEQLGNSGSRALPAGIRGRYVFWNQASTALFAIGSAGTEELAYSAAELYKMPANESIAGCTASFSAPSGAVAASEGIGGALVSAGAGCAWTATSSAPWLRLQTGGFGLGALGLSFAVEVNRLAVPRIATITLNGGATYTVTQSAAAVAVEPVTVSIPAAGASRSVAVSTASPATAWTATTNVPWISITGGGSGTGAGTVNYTVAANTGLSRSGLIRVNSVNVSILQDSAQTPGGNRTPNFVSATLLSDGRREFVFRDTDGANDLGVVNVLINRALDGRAACYLAYNASTEQFFLVDDAGTGLQALTLGGSTNIVTNSQCSISAAGFSATKLGDTLTLRVNIQLLPGFGGDKVIYAAARDLILANSGWQIAGVSRAAQSTTTLEAKLIEPADPTTVVGRNTFLTLQYESSFGIPQSEFTTSQILINNALDGANGCYLGFDRAANLVYLLSNDGSQLLLPGIPLGRDFTSSAIVVSNSQCEVSSFGSSVLANGPNSIQLVVNLSFRSSFTGTKLIHAGLQAGTGRNSGWKILQTLKVE